MPAQVVRLPFPVAFVDPAFRRCLCAAVMESEFVENFDRLYGTTLSLRPRREHMRAFANHVHDVLYLRLPDEVIVKLRVKREQS